MTTPLHQLSYAIMNCNPELVRARLNTPYFRGEEIRSETVTSVVLVSLGRASLQNKDEEVGEIIQALQNTAFSFKNLNITPLELWKWTLHKFQCNSRDNLSALFRLYGPEGESFLKNDAQKYADEVMAQAIAQKIDQNEFEDIDKSRPVPEQFFEAIETLNANKIIVILTFKELPENSYLNPEFAKSFYLAVTSAIRNHRTNPELLTTMQILCIKDYSLRAFLDTHEKRTHFMIAYGNVAHPRWQEVLRHLALVPKECEIKQDTFFSGKPFKDLLSLFKGVKVEHGRYIRPKYIRADTENKLYQERFQGMQLGQEHFKAYLSVIEQILNDIQKCFIDPNLPETCRPYYDLLEKKLKETSLPAKENDRELDALKTLDLNRILTEESSDATKKAWEQLKQAQMNLTPEAVKSFKEHYAHVLRSAQKDASEREARLARQTRATLESASKPKWQPKVKEEKPVKKEKAKEELPPKVAPLPAPPKKTLPEPIKGAVEVVVVGKPIEVPIRPFDVPPSGTPSEAKYLHMRDILLEMSSLIHVAAPTKEAITTRQMALLYTLFKLHHFMGDFLGQTGSFYTQSTPSREIRNTMGHKFTGFLDADIEAWVKDVVTHLDPIIQTKSGTVKLSSRVTLPEAIERILKTPDIRTLKPKQAEDLADSIAFRLKEVWSHWQRNEKIESCLIIGGMSAAKMLLTWLGQLAKDFPEIRARYGKKIIKERNMTAHGFARDANLCRIYYLPTEISETEVLLAMRRVLHER